ncbi:unnamed protein product [Withania somnifera]
MRVAIQSSWIRGFKMDSLSGEEMQICHLLYADDTVVFCEAKAEQLAYIRMILSLARILGCKVEQLPITYLGMPLRHKHKELEIWDGIIEKTEKKLANWKAQYISIGGRITLKNSVLDSLPPHVMSLFPIPAKEAFPISSGLGIRSFGLQNRCLLTKWLWRFTVEDQALWKEVIHNKYGLEGNCCSNTVLSTYGVSVWKTIRNSMATLSRNISYRVGNGSKILFWKENWIGNETLMVSFPDLFSLSINPDEKVANVWSPLGWNIMFRRLLNDWEVGRVTALLQVLDCYKDITDEKDSIRWKHARDGKFS